MDSPFNARRFVFSFPMKKQWCSLDKNLCSGGEKICYLEANKKLQILTWNKQKTKF